MARQPRLQFSGAHYLIFNRGDDGRRIFMQHDGAALFQEALAEACRRNGWRLFAYAVLKNRYYLVIETPKGNLTEGMQWLQSAFSNRLNLRRRSSGHIFSGRYKAQLIEPNHHLLSAVDFVHLSPVRLKLCEWENMDSYNCFSYSQYAHRGPMRSSLLCEPWLKHLGVFYEDPARVWPMYRNHLINVQESFDKDDITPRKFLSGWVIGSKDYKKQMVAKLKEGSQIKDWGGSSMREINELEWESLLEKCLDRLSKDSDDVSGDRKSATWKIAIAAYLKNHTSVSNPWIGKNLNMGAPAAVSRYVGTYLRSNGKEDPDYVSLAGVE